MIFRITYIVFATFLLTISLSACTTEAPKQMQMPPAVVQVAPVKLGPFKEKTDYICTLKSRKSVTLSPHVDGHITEIFVSSGQNVKAGDKIMKIDSRMQSAQTNAVEIGAASVESDLSTAKATLASLESALIGKKANVQYNETQLSRYTNLRKEGAVSSSDLDLWRNNCSTAQADRDATLQQIEAQKMTIQKFERNHRQMLANLDAQKEQLRYFEITAPFAGEIGDVPVKVGDHVSSASQLTSLTENHPLEAYIDVPAEKAGEIKKGQQVALTSSDGAQYGNSQVIFIAPVVDSNSQTVLVKALYPNTKSELRAAQTVRAQIVWHQKDGISVPTQAVRQAAGKFFVFVAEKGGAASNLVAKQTEIEVYGIEGSDYQVKSGLKPNDHIVLTGIQRLFDGAPIVAKAELNSTGETTAHRHQEIH